MKTPIGVWLSSFTLCLVSLTVQADPLLIETWDGTSIENAATISGDPLQNLGSWYAFISGTPRWGVETTGCTAPCDGSYAQHLVPPDGDNTNSLYYGIAGPFETGTTVLVSFDYIAEGRNAYFGLLGMTAGVDSLDPWAPFWYNGDVNDGSNVFNEVLLNTSEWANASFSVTLTEDYDALAFIVAMGGENGLRGIDNINVSTVPEPATLALFGLGLAGIGFSRRKKA